MKTFPMNVHTYSGVTMSIPNVDPLIKLDPGTWLMPHPTTRMLGEKESQSVSH